MNPDIIDRELHPIGTRLLVTMHRWSDEDAIREILEVFIAEWSPGGLVKVRYVGRDDEDEYIRWYRPEELRVVEVLQ